MSPDEACRQVLDDGFNGRVTLDYSRHEWNDAEMALLATTIKSVSCPLVTKLDLSYNDMSAAGLDALGEALKLGALSGLQELDVSHCPALRRLPDALGELSELVTINVSGCTGLASLPETLKTLVCLREIRATNCHPLPDEETLKKTVKQLEVELESTNQEKGIQSRWITDQKQTLEKEVADLEDQRCERGIC